MEECNQKMIRSSGKFGVIKPVSDTCILGAHISLKKAIKTSFRSKNSEKLAKTDKYDQNDWECLW